ncbi:hypothetical protein Cch01nite_23620 [Cellulomonas chitinilytica]|uniref:MinD-like ATPase involved in chromosome partitioning or flagellar assembly n=1 Tax=Cellulomonas chitinilytica TaxID=398759 RepID=A0A919U076_9CELL|nr:hypothetical protein [Cellulomonas chitinilytica]GIG21638.1 hypothetical protein Cch01nite_23620 [Cellulomonas chitinilytica]
MAWPGSAGVLDHVLASAVPDRARELVVLDRAVRAPLPLSTRVGVVGVSAGVGCSVVAGLVASALAARRPHRVLAVNASAGGRSLLWHAGATTVEPALPADDEARRGARTGAEAVEGLARTGGGLHCLDLAVDGAPVPDARWWEALGPAGRFFDVIVTDWGARSAARSGAVGASSSVVCVVAEAERSSWQHGTDLVGRVAADGVPAVLAVSAVRGRPAAWCAEAARLSRVPVVVVPHDRAHGAAAPVPAARLRAATGVAVLRLAAAVVSVAGAAVGPAGVAS